MDDEPSPLWWWKHLVDPLCGDDSRWSSSSRTSPFQSGDLIGNGLVSKLLHCARSVQNDRPIAGWSKTLLERLDKYEDESRLLVKLADTGRVVQLLERGIDTTLHILDIYTTDTRNEWREQLRLERENRMDLYEDLLAHKEFLELEMGDEVQQIEVLTLMKYGYEKFGEFLSPRELDVISAIFDAIVATSAVVVGVLPTWFTASRPDNARQTSVYDGEEACLRQVSLWARLHHPNVRKLYGACHVGVPFVLHEQDQPGPSTWSFFRDCAFGLEYMHQRGFTHNKLTASALCYRKDEKRGILSGLGLRTLSGKHRENDESAVCDLHPQISEDIEAFGRAIFVLLAQSRGPSNIEPDQQLSSSKPDFLSEGEWNLLEALRTSNGFGICDFFERMEELDKLERTQSQGEIYTLGKERTNNEPVEDITTYILPSAGKTISNILQCADPLCETVGERADMNRSVYERLIDLYDQFVQYPSALLVELVEDYALIVWDFFKRLEEQSDRFCSVSSLCAARTIANRNHSLHRDIDSLFFAKGSGALKWSDIHAWKVRTRCPTIHDELEFEDDEEGDTFLHMVDAFPSIDKSSRPAWFIPVEEVSRKASIANGAFGAVYAATWLGTSVVLKQVLTDQSNKVNRKQFYREANLWSHLSHKNLLQLYGANHEVRPFFVCEKAVGKTLPDFLKRERGSRLWKCIQQAALGLENLHAQGIIHGDLKGNNILVWMAHVTDFESATTKLADFGMSVRANGMESLINLGDLGALPWRAPEILSGDPPSFASDIYSFGMCIIEAATGAHPIRWHISGVRDAPSRPQELSEGQWGLITRMCCLDPLKRIDANTVVNILYNGAFDGRHRNDISRRDDNPESDTRGKGMDNPALVPKPVPRSGNRWHRKNILPNIVQTPDRLGDYLAALRNDFVLKNPVCRRGLNLSGEMDTYEKEARVLLKLASTGRVVNILLRFGGVIEGYMKVMAIKATEEVLVWKEQLEIERRQRIAVFKKILKDEQRLVEAIGDETQQIKLMTLLRYDVAKYSDILTPEELSVMSDAYDRVVEHSGIVLVGKPPIWFMSPNDLLCENGIYYLDGARVSKCLTGEVLSTVTDHESWEDQEEACLRQATVWADLNHPHVAKMLGACHIGKGPFVIHEPVEPLVSNQANAQSWEPLLGWALGLQYLHERELGYKDFDDSRLLAHHHVSASGVLTGLGLVPIKSNMSVSLNRDVAEIFNTEEVGTSSQRPGDEDILQESPSWSALDDIFAFGLAIYNTRQWVSMYSDETVLVLPPECPSFLDDQEWDLIQRMCARIPQERVSMWYVVHQLQVFVKYPKPMGVGLPISRHVDAGDEMNEAATEHPSSPPKHIDDFIVHKMNDFWHNEVVHVTEAIEILGDMCADMSESDPFVAGVFKRLSTLYSLLRTPDRTKNAINVMEAFVDVVNLFYSQLTRLKRGNEIWGLNGSEDSFCDDSFDPFGSEMARFCASRIAAQNAAMIHHEIDRLLMLAELRDTFESAQATPSHAVLADIHQDSTDSVNADVHDWHKKWTKLRREQLGAFQSCLRITEELTEHLSDPKARLEAQMLLQFELHNRRSSYPNSVLDAMTQTLKVLKTMGDGAEAKAVPSWFIPRYEIVVKSNLDSDGFGEAYYGKWFDKDIMVWFLRDPPSSEEFGATSSDSSDDDVIQWFWRAANHWFMLNHQNVVQLYGACHVGTQFFVCERTKATSLTYHVKELASTKPGYNFDENGGDRSDVMRCLFLAGLGLKYVHERGIVHCDLKGSNFIVGTDSKTIKLRSLALSSWNGQCALHLNGAVRWKAPEYLEGEPATVMSAVYSFGMCILEILSGEYPWGRLDDVVVKHLVVKGKRLPSRPKNTSDFQWSMVENMCCYNPSERISLDAVVDMLYAFRFE